VIFNLFIAADGNL